MIKQTLAAVALAGLLCGCSQNRTNDTTTTSTVSRPAATNAATAAAPNAAPTTASESNQANAAGDIPDTQAFVTFSGAGYSVLVPEGWARTQRGSAVAFTWNANSETIDTSAAPDTTAQLRARFGATGPITFRRSGAPVTVVGFTSRSAPDAVTGKRVRLENNAYVFERNGHRALLVLSAPAGADNVDQWKKISESFRWK